MADVAATTSDQTRRISIGFINFAHAIDHYVMLIFPTVVIGLEAVYGRSYAELIALGTASFVAFGIFSLPAGWLADRWSRRNMMVVFYFGCGVSLVGAALAPNLVVLAVALFALGMFAAIYHPVGTAMLIEQATTRGRSLAFNGVCGNLGVAFAAGITAALAVWRSDGAARSWCRRRSASRPASPICGWSRTTATSSIQRDHDAGRSARRLDRGHRVRPVHRDRAHGRSRVPHRDGGAAEDRRRAARRRAR